MEAGVEVSGREVHLILVTSSPERANSLAQTIVDQLKSGVDNLKSGAINLTLMDKPASVEETENEQHGR